MIHYVNIKHDDMAALFTGISSDQRAELTQNAGRPGTGKGSEIRNIVMQLAAHRLMRFQSSRNIYIASLSLSSIILSSRSATMKRLV